MNLRGRLKITTPRYTGLQADAIPALAADDGRATVNLISGEWGGRKGPFESLTGVFMTTITLTAGATVAFDGAEGRNVFLYVVRGDIAASGTPAKAWNLVQMSLQGDRVELTATTDAVVLFGHGAPIAEPVVAHGPFVMNTREEIVQAIQDYQAGRFDAVTA